MELKFEKSVCARNDFKEAENHKALGKHFRTFLYSNDVYCYIEQSVEISNRPVNLHLFCIFLKLCEIFANIDKILF